LREAWRLTNKQATPNEALSQGTVLTPKLREKEQRKLRYAMGSEAWRDSVYLAWAKSRAPLTDRAWDRMLKLPARWVVPSFPVAGRDLLALGFPSGPDLGRELKRLEDYWIARTSSPQKKFWKAWETEWPTSSSEDQRQDGAETDLGTPDPAKLIA
jgi:hypothetical protein